jgi:hypothetical protein
MNTEPVLIYTPRVARGDKRFNDNRTVCTRLDEETPTVIAASKTRKRSRNSKQ